jgi:hypothetical protein
MRQRIWVALAGTIAMAAAGCTSSDTPAPTASVSPVSQPAKVAQSPTATQNFSQPTVNPKLPPPPSAIPGLIQSTNGEERAKQVQAGIQASKAQRDPFKSVPTPVVTLLPNPQPTPAVSAPQVASAPARPATPGSARPGSARPGSVQPGLVPLKPGLPGIAALPPLPTANLANAVEVTGVVQVGGVPQAIIKSPNERTSRYVRTGQRLANGQVLVKRIDVYTGSGTPVVILEENGIEVARAVGDSGPKSAKPV